MADLCKEMRDSKRGCNLTIGQYSLDHGTNPIDDLGLAVRPAFAKLWCDAMEQIRVNGRHRLLHFLSSLAGGSTFLFGCGHKRRPGGSALRLSSETLHHTIS